MESSLTNFELNSKTTIKELTKEDKKLKKLINKLQTAKNAKRAWVKGGSWDDKGCGVCRPAARHSRPIELKHILIGFRLVKE